jgi:hypothetical protein
MRIVKVKIVNVDMEFELEVPDYFKEEDIYKMAKIEAQQLSCERYVELIIES